jgi:H+/gluconate symporter-like permease
MSMGINPEALHRIMLLASGGLDSLPHCGAVITLLSVCKLTHKESYGDIAVLTMVLPLISVVVTSIVYLTTGLV